MHSHQQHDAANASMNHDMQTCMTNCHACHDACLEAVAYCLKQGGMHAEAMHITLLLDCEQICMTSHDFMARASSLHARICAACAEVCAACAESCEAMGDDATMKHCAESCRRCAESCRQMAAMN